MLKKTFAYFFLILFINISFSQVYQLVLKKTESLELLNVIAEEEKHEAKKIVEVDKHYSFPFSLLPSYFFILHDFKYRHTSSDLLTRHPERESPPPKSYYHLS